MSAKDYKISMWLAEFADRDAEMDFQNHMQPTMSRQLQVVLIIWAVLLSLFAVPDLILLGPVREFYYLLTFRLFSLVAIGILFFMVKPKTNMFKISCPVILLVMAYTTGFMMFFIYRSDSTDIVMGVVALQMISLQMYFPIRFILLFSAAGAF